MSSCDHVDIVKAAICQSDANVWSLRNLRNKKPQFTFVQIESGVLHVWTRDRFSFVSSILCRKNINIYIPLCPWQSLLVALSGHWNIHSYLYNLFAHTNLSLIFSFFLQTIQAALRDEALFFQKNYPALASRNGTPFLARNLNKV